MWSVSGSCRLLTGTHVRHTAVRSGTQYSLYVHSTFPDTGRDGRAGGYGSVCIRPDCPCRDLTGGHSYRSLAAGAGPGEYLLIFTENWALPQSMWCEDLYCGKEAEKS